MNTMPQKVTDTYLLVSNTAVNSTTNMFLYFESLFWIRNTTAWCVAATVHFGGFSSSPMILTDFFWIIWGCLRVVCEAFIQTREEHSMMLLTWVLELLPLARASFLHCLKMAGPLEFTVNVPCLLTDASFWRKSLPDICWICWWPSRLPPTFWCKSLFSLPPEAHLMVLMVESSMLKTSCSHSSPRHLDRRRSNS